jgi:hypothetical protein
MPCLAIPLSMESPAVYPWRKDSIYSSFTSSLLLLSCIFFVYVVDHKYGDDALLQDFSARILFEAWAFCGIHQMYDWYPTFYYTFNFREKSACTGVSTIFMFMSSCISEQFLIRWLFLFRSISSLPLHNPPLFNFH